MKFNILKMSMLCSLTSGIASVISRVAYSTRLKSLRQKPVKVITDIDDTVKSSGGVKIFGISLGGVDVQYKRGDFYPGAFQFAFELSHANRDGDIDKPQNMSVLTARAREFLFALALKPTDKLCTAYRCTGQKNGVDGWGIGDVYYGSVAEWIFSNRKGLRKFQNFELMLNKDDQKGKCDYVIVGDTGERDEEAAERIVDKYGTRVRAVFLHSVSGSKDVSIHRIPSDRVVDGVPFFYFKTYVGAAAKAVEHGLMEPNGLQKVIKEAVDDLDRNNPYRFPSDTVTMKRNWFLDTVSSNSLKVTQWNDLQKDIDYADAVSSQSMRLGVIQLISQSPGRRH